MLQIPSVFLNVSKGQAAPKADLEKIFGKNTSTDDIILEILNKGELQVGEKERQAELERLRTEVIDIVAGKLVDPGTKRVYTPGMIEKALDILSQQGVQASGSKAMGSKSASGTASPGTPNVTNGESPQVESWKGKGRASHTWTGVVTTKSAKSQALDAMKALITHQPIPVMRARMRLRVTCPTSVLKQAVRSVPKGGTVEDGDLLKATGTVKDRILSNIEVIESQEVIGEEWEATGLTEPGALKALTDLLGSESKGKGRVEVLGMHEGE